jgi:hypothetical protein
MENKRLAMEIFDTIKVSNTCQGTVHIIGKKENNPLTLLLPEYLLGESKPFLE